MITNCSLLPASVSLIIVLFSFIFSFTTPKSHCWVFHCFSLYYPCCPSWFNLQLYYTHSEMHKPVMHRVFKMLWALHSLKIVFYSFLPNFYLLFALLSLDQHWTGIFIKILHPQESILELYQLVQNLSLVCKIKIVSSLCTLLIYTDYSTSIEIEFSFTSQFPFIKGYINLLFPFILLYSIFSSTRGCLGRKKHLV